VLVDDCDTLPPATLRKLVERRRICRGMFLTATTVASDTSTLLDTEHDHYVPIPHLDERPEDLLFVAGMIWDQMPMLPQLADACDESAVEALLQGVYAKGAWSLQDALTRVAELLEASGDLVAGHLRRKITSVDITPLLLRLAKEQVAHVRVAPTDAVLVVEGDTDEIYLRRAAELAHEQHGWRLLDGLQVQPAVVGRGGGGNAVVTRLLEFQRQGVTAIGLFDMDRPGSAAFEIAGKHNLRRILLPARFDPIARDPDNAIVEIEDLLPSELLARYYETHPETHPEERHWRLGRWRIIPLGRDKGPLAEWASSVATYRDMERYVYLLVQAREQLRLPCSTDMRDKSWLPRLQQRPTSELMGVTDNGQLGS